jgi:hypothetical protein
MPPKSHRSPEFTAFDSLVGDLLKVPKAELDAKVKAHKEQAALNPRKRGPKVGSKRKARVTEPSDGAHVADAS